MPLVPRYSHPLPLLAQAIASLEQRLTNGSKNSDGSNARRVSGSHEEKAVGYQASAASREQLQEAREVAVHR
jgi:hypothetical protein